MADITEKDDNLIIEDETNLAPEVDDELEGHEPDTDDDDDDERIQQETEDEDREAIRERRRKEKIERKERREQAIKRDKLELGFLRKRNDDLERRISAQEQRAHQGDLSAIDNAIAQSMRDIDMADKIISKAIEAGNGDDVAQALRYRDEAKLKVQQLNYQKQQSQQPAQSSQPQIDDMTMHYAKEFIEDHPWYDTKGGNEDSAIVIAIDQSLAREGYDPKSEEYWLELRKRTAKRLPERFEKPRTPRGGPAVGSGKEHAPTSTRKEIHISPERKQALIDAGVWDDSVLRMKYIKRYAEYDKQNKNA